MPFTFFPCELVNKSNPSSLSESWAQFYCAIIDRSAGVTDGEAPKGSDECQQRDCLTLDR